MAAPGALTNVVTAIDNGGSATTLATTGMGTATDDRVAGIGIRGDKTGSVAVDTSGWTLIGSEYDSTSDVTLAWAYDGAGTSDGCQFSWTTGAKAVMWSGRSPDTDFDTTAPAINTNGIGTVSGSTHTMVSVAWTPTTDDVRVVSMVVVTDGRRNITAYPDADNNTTVGGGSFDVELAMCTGGYTATSPASPGDFVWNNTVSGALQGLVLKESTGLTISPALVTQSLTGVNPQLNMNFGTDLVTQPLTAVDPTRLDMNIAPTLVTQSVAGVDPSLTPGPVQIDPALVTQLLAGVDPQVNMAIAVALVTQSLTAVDPTRLDMNIAPTLASQLLAGVDPTVSLASGTQQIDPALVTQSLTAVDPTRLDMNIAPTLASQLLAGVDPQVNMAIATVLVSQLLTAVDPTRLDMSVAVSLETQLLTAVDPTVSLAAGAQQIDPALVTQSLTAVDPTLTPGAVSIDPVLVSQLVAAGAPQINLNIAPALASQLVAGVNPRLNMSIAAALVQQLVAAIDPTVTGGTQPTWIVINMGVNWATQAEESVNAATGAVSSAGNVTGAEHR